MLTFDSLKIWFIRHAESEANLQRIYANEGCSFPLTVNGLQQARTFALRFSSLGF
jgi:broad specificity phosphatase PhoE